jgi:hypothetical protein
MDIVTILIIIVTKHVYISIKNALHVYTDFLFVKFLCLTFFSLNFYVMQDFQISAPKNIL